MSTRVVLPLRLEVAHSRGCAEDATVIRLTVPGELPFRDVAMRVVASAVRLLRPGRTGAQAPPSGTDLQDEFAAQVVSAVSEAFNNVAIHGYGESGPAPIEIEVRCSGEYLEIALRDFGASFDPAGYDQAPDALPERGMGLFIIRSFVDELSYESSNRTHASDSATPNVLTLRRRWPSADESSAKTTAKG